MNLCIRLYPLDFPVDFRLDTIRFFQSPVPCQLSVSFTIHFAVKAVEKSGFSVFI
ncbi:hypothetical protein [Moorena sp. SIO3I6]|uniref:hypothetical protein n=1 Tax=Moorena sp. SIO3I6 TaxID=2607831 RepID=UPI0013F992B9|nr:hypothetical protein [Moorena sp. SIO3I6]NEP27729.1 hypothetical protein [Moorena sp. SIO3I6]